MALPDLSLGTRLVAYAIVMVVTGAGLLGLDVWSGHKMATDTAMREFVLTDAFWLTVAGGAAVALAMMIGMFLLITFWPGGADAQDRGE